MEDEKEEELSVEQYNERNLSCESMNSDELDGGLESEDEEEEEQ